VSGKCATISVAAIHAAVGAGLADLHRGQAWQYGVEAVPDPAGDLFAGRVLEAGNFVEITMVQRLVNWPASRFDVGEIHYPAGLGPDRAFDPHRDLKGMAVQAPAFVFRRDIGQVMGGLKAEGAEYFHDAGGVVLVVNALAGCGEAIRSV